jgi:hypothetical protein
VEHFDVLFGRVSPFLNSSEELRGSLISASQSEYEVECGFLLDVVIRESSRVFELFSGEDETLLIGRDAFLVLDFGLDVFDGVALFDVEGDCFPRECFYENLHVFLFVCNEKRRRVDAFGF